MANIRYYLTLFPTEGLIASMLNPEQFGFYMATSSKKGSHERLIFIEITKEFAGPFDWAYARERCVPHKNGEPKHSVYLSVYRVLERIPLDALGTLHLTTSDGRTLSIEAEQPQAAEKTYPYYLYQELCPVQPLVVSSLAPAHFAAEMVSGKGKISFPALFFCDLKVINVKDVEHTGNIGPMYDRNLGHLLECIQAVTERGKTTKTLDRTFAGSFTFQIVKSGFTLVNETGKVWYPMPNKEDLATRYYDWSRSAMIV